MTELPKGWAKCVLSDLAEWSSGGTPSRGNKAFFGGDIPWVKTGELSQKYIWDTEEKLTALGLEKSSAKVCPAGSVGIAMYGATIGKVSIWRIDAATNQACAVAQPFAGVTETNFLYHFLRSEKDAFVKKGKGGAQPNISQGLLKDWPVCLPPLNEQSRIVEKIEAMFERIDKGVENLRGAKVALALYRQSLLKSAFEGKLTADWRAQNADKLEPPKTLLARIQKERETRYKSALDDWQTALAEWRAGCEVGRKPGKPSRPRDMTAKAVDMGLLGWATIPLGLMIDTPAYGTSKKCDYNGGTHGVLRIPNVGSGRIDATDLKSANFDEGEIEQYSLMEGDILTVRSNGSLSAVGKPAIISAKDVGYLFAGYLIRLRAIPGSLVPQYLANLMTEPHIRGQIEEKAKSTSGINNISAKELQDLNVPVCSPAEQAEITRILDTRLTAADRMEAEIDAALSRADALRQSILKRAFAGNLVPQDPTDEPAPTLLARIKAERAKAGKTKPRKTAHAG